MRIVTGGDFSCLLNPLLDKKGGTLIPHTPVRAYLHGTTLSHATSLRQTYDTNCFV